MQYKVFYRPYDITSLIENAKGKGGTSEATCETGDWNIALNKYAKNGWKVKKCGTITSGRDVIFWAFMEKE